MAPGLKIKWPTLPIFVLLEIQSFLFASQNQEEIPIK